MPRANQTAATAMLCISAFLMISCGKPDSSAENMRSAGTQSGNSDLNLYTWADYIGPNTIASFEKLTGIKVHISYFESEETLESRMLTGNSGFDVVTSSGPYFQRQIRSGAYLLLDKSKLPNLVNLDPALMSRVTLYDPGNAHGVVYTWGTQGIAYNEKMVAAVLPNVRVNSWRVIFDPVFASKLAKCGINILDTPAGVVRLVLQYLGKNPNSPTPQDLSDVESVFVKIRPYVRTIDSSPYIQALANGDICIALGTNGDVAQARKQVNETRNGIKIDWVIPDEGSLLWIDELAIPRDAPHVANAHLFIDYLMNPQVIADISDFIGFANGNAAALPLMDSPIVADPIIYPPPDKQQRLFLQLDDTPEQSRAITRIWQKFKTGQ